MRDLRTAFLASGRRDLFAAISKVKTLHAEPSSYTGIRHQTTTGGVDPRTRFVPLCSVQMESPISTRSPSEKGNELPFAMADATADLRKSMCGVVVGPGGGLANGPREGEQGCLEDVLKVTREVRRGKEEKNKKYVQSRLRVGILNV